MSELIKNTKNWGAFCTTCGNKGIVRIPVPEDEAKYDELFDKYDSPGHYSTEQCREIALDGCKCNTFYCPKCEKGLKYSDKHPKYEGN